MRSSLVARGAATCALITAGLAAPEVHAGDPVTDRFDNIDQIQIAGFTDVTFSTGWIPAGSPVQLSIDVAAANTLALSMFGEALYDWETETVRFEGGDQGGSFQYDVGLQLHAAVKVDVIGFSWTSDLLGPYDLLVDDDAKFTPYLLPGNPDRPVVVSDKTEGVTVASVPLLPDIVIASGNLDIDVAFDVSASLEGKSIRVTGPLNEASVIAEGESVPLWADEVADWTQPFEAEAQLLARVTTDTTIIVRPHLVMTVFGTDYDIAGIDIPVPLPEYDDDFVFDPVPLQFDRPEPAGETGGASGEDSGSDDAGEVGTGESGDDAGFDGQLDDGCACRTDDEREGWGASGLLLLVVMLRPRRRRSCPPFSRRSRRRRDA